MPSDKARHWIRAWGSRGRRFKSGRPDWSKPHFRTQKPCYERLMGAQRAPISSMKLLWCGLWEDITPLVSRCPPSLPMASPARGALVSEAKGHRFTSGRQGWLWATPTEDPGGSVTVSDGNCLKRTRAYPPFGTPSRASLAVHASPRIDHAAPGIRDLGSLIEGPCSWSWARGLRPPGWAVSCRVAVVLTLAAGPARAIAAARGVRPALRRR
jgi:hypothetical protein